MADPFVAEIRIFPFNFAPKGWAFCDGQLLPISQNTALFALVGTYYGGDGKSTFGLPNLQGSVPMHTGYDPGPGLSMHDLGQLGGSEHVTLLETEIPVHNHLIQADLDPAGLNLTGPTRSLARSSGSQAYAAAPPVVTTAFQSLTPTGGSLPHNNMMPYLTLNFCIALQGVYPSRP